MPEPSVAELLVRIENLEHRRRPLRWPAPRKRGAIAVVAGIALLMTPLVTFASNAFEDVPEGDQFHTVIGRVADAGITAGCTPSTYCPDAAVTRAQMAAFLNRASGRAGSKGFDTSLFEGDELTAEVTLRASDVTGGSQNVVLLAEAMIQADIRGACPCRVVFALYDGETMIPFTYREATLDNTATSGIGTASVSLSAVVVAPTGVTGTYSLRATHVGAAALIRVSGNVIAMAVPFASDGSAPGN